MGDEAAEQTDGHETPLPLSESFRDTAFIKFVNEADSRNKSNSPAQGAVRANAVSNAGKRGHGGHHNSSVANSHRPQHSSKVTDSPLQTREDGVSGSHRGGHASNSTDDDGDWDELDNIELDSQTMRQLVETEEHFYATQQFLVSTDMPLSQEFAEPPSDAKQRVATRCASAGGGFRDSRGPQTVPSPAAQSVPVTPTSGAPIYISDSDSPARYSGSETGIAHGMAAGASLGASVPSQPHPPQLQPYQQQQQQQRQGLGRASSAHLPLNESARRRTNLFPRLAAHIPPKASDTSFPHHRRPPPLASGSAALAHQSTHQWPRLQQQTGNGIADQRFDLGTSILASPSSSNHRVAASRSSGVPLPQALQQRADSSSAMDEMRRLREENARMRAEHDSLRAQLYTKEGEVKIVRDNLAKTEIENTHLQERLANQISASTAAQEQAEKSLSAEIERLKTQLLFQQHEVQAATASQTPTRTATPRSVRAARSPSSGRKGAYPSFEEFMATPKQPTRTTSASALSKTPQTSTPQQRQKTRPKHSASATSNSPQSSTPLQRQKRQPEHVASVASPIGRASDIESQAAESAAGLLEMLTRIAQHPADAEFGGLMLLAVQLAKAARAPDSETISAFHAQACNMLDHLSRPSGHKQLESVVGLLLQAVDLPAICSPWLLDMSQHEIGGSADQENRTVVGGHYRLGQLCTVLSKALQADVAASVKLRHGGRESAACGRAISAQVRLVVRLIGLQPAAALGNDVWAQFSVHSLAVHIAPGLHLAGLSAVLELVTVLIQASPQAWQHLRDHPPRFEQLLVAALKRLRLAFARNESRMLDAHRKLLVLIASAIVTQEEDSRSLINATRQLTVALVRWFLDEHTTLTGTCNMPPHAEQKRVAVFCEHIKCLNVILSEVDDVVALLGGDESPLLFAFIAASTRMTFGERPFAGLPALQELAADLLAYVVTEDQALSIQDLVEF
ncbi:hypothetical protein H4R20_001646 [Coemansia guatemalensis]|uniref:Uncharacterized protein n=1 Tax=Coemansia guatemalensis TaxID=2761395 RepID=A0A9W8HWZ0_9FUNG|nr:hypothetical protein H4R20_001646 [Coemansia guatemalensis]